MADKLDGLITAIYEASLDASAWEGVGLLLPQAFKGDGCLIQRRDLATRTATLFTVKGMDGINWRDYEQYYCQHDLWALGAGKRPLNGAYHFHELVAPDTYERSEIYNDFLRPPCDVDIFWGMGTLLTIDSTTVGGIGILRDRKHGSFDERMRRQFLRIIPHLCRAIQITTRLKVAEGCASSAFGALDALTIGVLLVRANSEVVHANAAALRLLKAGNGLWLDSHHRLEADRPEEAARLRMLVNSAARRDLSDPRGSGGALRIGRMNAEPPLAAMVAPLPKMTQKYDGANAIVLFSDPATTVTPRLEMLSILFQLTPAEARLASAMADGTQSLRSAATKLKISTETARSQLKNIFAKMNISRQAELAAIMARTGLMKL